MRDKLIHDYFGIDYEIVWHTIQNKLPEFFKRIVNTKLDADTMKDSDEILKELNLDEKDVIRALHSELYPLLNQIRKIAHEHEDGNGNPNQNSTTNIRF